MNLYYNIYLKVLNLFLFPKVSETNDFVCMTKCQNFKCMSQQIKYFGDGTIRTYNFAATFFFTVI